MRIELCDDQIDRCGSRKAAETGFHQSRSDRRSAALVGRGDSNRLAIRNLESRGGGEGTRAGGADPHRFPASGLAGQLQAFEIPAKVDGVEIHEEFDGSGGIDGKDGTDKLLAGQHRQDTPLSGRRFGARTSVMGARMREMEPSWPRVGIRRHQEVEGVDRILLSDSPTRVGRCVFCAMVWHHLHRPVNAIYYRRRQPC